MLRLRVFFACHRVCWLLSLLAAALIVWALSMELSLRRLLTYMHNPVNLPSWSEYRPHPTLFWTLRPHLRGKMRFASRACSDPLPGDKQSFYVSTNSWGMRGPEISRKKPADTKRILCAGNDILFGYGVGDDDTVESVLQRGLARSSKDSLQVLNGSCPGWSSYQGREWTRIMGRSFEPDVYIVSYGYADSAPEDMTDSSRVSSFAPWRWLQLALYRSELYMYLHQQNTIAVNPYGLPPIDYQRRKLRVPIEEYRANLIWFADIAKQDNARVIYLNLPFKNIGSDISSEYRFTMQDVAQSTGSLYVDAQIITQYNGSYKLFNETKYPSVQVYKMMATALMAELQKSGWLK